jgi:hypothetical protein
MTYFSALANRRLGREAEPLITGLEAYAAELAATPAQIDYFATSLPTMLLFTDDLQRRQETTAMFLDAQAAALRGRRDEALAGAATVLTRDPNHLAAATFTAGLIHQR